ncbi:hypothetical protein [Leptolyngbya sp. O-77]|uniref:hypothetical protein n=1 Tax=Leptolyngbya sp. O-77 TaxID=1080068 RepID=UPI00074D4CF9|nr:hypothetical protein [Leptolyngbya sp. O-77]BAU43241.1 hypothetical protein O77CONTIG1_03068 [Leptolyngbya sp. O-77]
MNKAEFLAQVAYARRFSAEDVFFGDTHSEYPDLAIATLELLENGETAWGVPEFEQCLYQAFLGWASQGQLIRLWLTGKWLLGSAPPSSRAWLQDLLAGEFCQHLDGFELQGDRLGPSQVYLYPFNFRMLVQSQ